LGIRWFEKASGKNTKILIGSLALQRAWNFSVVISGMA
jgi:hypothetical protein